MWPKFSDSACVAHNSEMGSAADNKYKLLSSSSIASKQKKYWVNPLFGLTALYFTLPLVSPKMDETPQLNHLYFGRPG